MKATVSHRRTARHVPAVIALLALTLIAAACTGRSTSKSGHTYQLSFGTPNPTSAVDTKAVLEWVEQVKKDTHGEVVIKEYPNDQLGNDATEMTATIRGSQQGFAGTTADLENYTKTFSVLDLPYVFPHAEKDAQPLLFGSVGQTLTKDLEGHGLEVVGWLDEGSRDLISKTMVSKPEQLKGMKVRVIQAPIPEGQYKALGADTNAIAFSDVYTALETNVVSALDEPVDDLYSKKFYQQVCCLAETQDILTVNPMVINKSFWDSLPANDQKIVKDDATKIMKQEWTNEVKTADEDIAAMQKDGLKVAKINVNDWVKAWQPFDQSYVSKLPANVQKLYKQIKASENDG